MKALIVSQYGPRAASSRTRVFQYLPYLKDHGVDVDLVVVVPDDLVVTGTSTGILARVNYYLKCYLRTIVAGLRCAIFAYKYRIIYIQKVLLPFPFPELLRRSRQKVLFDFDDAIFTTEAPVESWLARIRTWRHRSGLPRMLKSSGHTIVENGYTGNHASKFGANVMVITGPIDTTHYFPAESEPTTEVVLGWIGSRSTTRYLEIIRKPLVEIKDRFPEISLRLIGAGDFDLKDFDVEHIPWTIDQEVRDLRTFDIGLMPLPDDPWTRGKGGYKLLQYMSLGIPAVASPVGVNIEIVDDGVDGYLATTDDDWVERLSELISNPELRTRMGKFGREKMVHRYSLQKASMKLLQTFETVAEG